MIQKDSKYERFEIFPSIDANNNSIINFQIKKDEDSMMDKKDLEKLHKAMEFDLSNDFLKQKEFIKNESTLKQVIHIGKPVKISYEGSAIFRLAIGFDDTQKIMDKLGAGHTNPWDEDVKVLDKLAYLTQHFDKLDSILAEKEDSLIWIIEQSDRFWLWIWLECLSIKYN